MLRTEAGPENGMYEGPHVVFSFRTSGKFVHDEYGKLDHCVQLDHIFTPCWKSGVKLGLQTEFTNTYGDLYPP